MIRYFHAHAKRGQIASLDIILSVVALLLFIGIIIAILPMISERNEPKAAYGGQVFINIENMASDRPYSAFLSDYKIDEKSLDNFSNSSYQDIKEQVLVGSDMFNPDSSDFCMFFLPISLINGSNAFGYTYDSPDHATAIKKLCNPDAPCDNYIYSYIYVKPVLRNSKITRLYIAVCK